MANDPEARASGSSAIIIAVVALILIAGVAFMLMNRGEAPDTVINNPAPSAPSTTVVEKETIKEVPGPGTTVVVPPATTKSDAPAAPAGDGAQPK